RGWFAVVSAVRTPWMETVAPPVALLLPRPQSAPLPAVDPEAQARVKSILAYHRALAQDPSTVAGYVMELVYDAGVVITNDYYKLRVGGLPKNCFLLIRPGPLHDLVQPDTDACQGEPRPPAGRAPPIVFGGDVQNFLRPHLYSVHMPPPAVLQELINAFVDPGTRRPIGSVRLTESLPVGPASRVSVFVSPADFIGSRTALFGK